MFDDTTLVPYCGDLSNDDLSALEEPDESPMRPIFQIVQVKPCDILDTHSFRNFG